MRWLPYHHDWKPVFSGEQKWRVHWFGRYRGYPEYKAGTARLAPDMIGFLFIEHNTCWASVNGTRLLLKPGDLLVISGADEFTLEHNPARPHVCLSVSLSLSQGGAANTLLRYRFKRRYSLREPRRYVALCEAVLALLAGASPYRDLQIAGALADWLGYLLATLQPAWNRAAASDRSVVDRVLAAQAWAAGRLQTVITLSAWAASVKLGAVYFGRIFRRETGVRPMEWLNERRLEAAAQHLAATDKSVSEIAADCGYACPFYFSRKFRRKYKASPLQYRKSRSRRRK